MDKGITYVVTYTSDRMSSLDDDFYCVKIMAHTPQDAYTIIQNVESHFGAVVVTMEEEEPTVRKKRRVRRAQQGKKIS